MRECTRRNEVHKAASMRKGQLRLRGLRLKSVVLIFFLREVNIGWNFSLGVKSIDRLIALLFPSEDTILREWLDLTMVLFGKYIIKEFRINVREGKFWNTSSTLQKEGTRTLFDVFACRSDTCRFSLSDDLHQNPAFQLQSYSPSLDWLVALWAIKTRSASVILVFWYLD